MSFTRKNSSKIQKLFPCSHINHDVYIEACPCIEGKRSHSKRAAFQAGAVAPRPDPSWGCQGSWLLPRQHPHIHTRTAHNVRGEQRCAPRFALWGCYSRFSRHLRAMTFFRPSASGLCVGFCIFAQTRNSISVMDISFQDSGNSQSAFFITYLLVLIRYFSSISNFVFNFFITQIEIIICKRI